MSCCLSAETKAYYEAQKTTLANIIAEIEDAMLKGATRSYISSYELDTGAGKQKMTYKNINEMIKGLKDLTALYGWYCDKLSGVGVVDMTLRRKGWPVC